MGLLDEVRLKADATYDQADEVRLKADATYDQPMKSA